jgi:NitT/TauT family transport system substrate-binding protein
MKFLKILLSIILIIALAIFIKIKFFNPFEQDVTLTSQQSDNNGSKKLKKLVLAGPFASVSHPLIHMVNSGALSDIANEVEFRLWRDPDQLRAMVLNGEVNFVAVPTNVAANLYNKKVKIQLVNVSVWGILGMLSNDENLKTLKDFDGKNILVPFRSDMPDIVLKELLKAQGIKANLSYVSNPIDAMQQIIMGRADHALLAEPAISMALRKTSSFPLKAIAPKLFRSADLQEEWATTFKTDKKLPEAGMAVLGDVDPAITKRFNEEYTKALNWYKNNPKEAGIETAEALPMLDADALADSISYVNLESVSAINSREKLESFLKVMMKSEPKLIGGKIPNDGFYFKP